MLIPSSLIKILCLSHRLLTTVLLCLARNVVQSKNYRFKNKFEIVQLNKD